MTAHEPVLDTTTGVFELCSGYSCDFRRRPRPGEDAGRTMLYPGLGTRRRAHVLRAR